MTNAVVKNTVFLSLDARFPKDVLVVYMENPTSVSRSECIFAFKQAMNNKDPMKIWEQDISSVCDMFEAIILNLLEQIELGDHELDWLRDAVITMCDAYLYACDKNDAVAEGDFSSHETVLHRALSFVIRCQKSKTQIYSKNDALKKISYYSLCAPRNKIEGLEEYMLSFLEDALVVLNCKNSSTDLFTEESWYQVARVLKFLIEFSYFPKNIDIILPKLLHEVKCGDFRFTRDVFGVTLWHKARYQLAQTDLIRIMCTVKN